MPEHITRYEPPIRGRLIPMTHGWWLEQDDFGYDIPPCRSNLISNPSMVEGRWSSQPMAIPQERPKALLWIAVGLLGAIVGVFAIIGVLSVIHG